MDAAWNDPTVTGNGLFDNYDNEVKCATYLQGNGTLVDKAMHGLCNNYLPLDWAKPFGTLDKVVRCWLLPQVLDDIWADFQVEETEGSLNI